MVKTIAVFLMACYFCQATMAGQPRGAPEEFLVHKTKEEALRASGLDVYNTEENNLFVDKISKNAQELRRSLGRTYGGHWLAYNSKNKAYQVVAVTMSTAQSKGLARSPENRIVYVKNSF